MNIKQYEVTNKLLRTVSPDLSKNERIILVQLSSFLNLEKYPNGTVLLANSLIQKYTDIGRNAVESAIRGLKAKKYISRRTHTYVTYINIEQIMSLYSEDEDNYDEVDLTLDDSSPMGF